MQIYGQLDCLLWFSHLAKDNNYSNPNVNDSSDLEIKEGRHPVIEQAITIGRTLYCLMMFI